MFLQLSQQTGGESAQHALLRAENASRSQMQNRFSLYGIVMRVQSSATSQQGEYFHGHQET
jgi:hypothetical protein